MLYPVFGTAYCNLCKQTIPIGDPVCFSTDRDGKVVIAHKLCTSPDVFLDLDKLPYKWKYDAPTGLYLCACGLSHLDQESAKRCCTDGR